MPIVPWNSCTMEHGTDVRWNIKMVFHVFRDMEEDMNHE